MNLSIKQFAVKMELLPPGVELEVRDRDDNHLGNLVITNSRIIWCRPRVQRANGTSITWKKFIEFMDGQG